MNYTLDDNKLTVTLDLKPDQWWLLNGKGNGSKEWGEGIWYLAEKIDRSYKGKDPDVAVPTLTIESPELLADLMRLGIDIIWV